MEGTSPQIRPLIFDFTLTEQKKEWNKFFSNNPDIELIDTREGQLVEWIKIKNPGKNFSPENVNRLKQEWKNSRSWEEMGLMVYYPWLKKGVFLLGKDEFIELRTSRNQYKITPSEQNTLAQKKIGIIGLSVGSAIALTLATERCCGEIRLADFDEIELSNLNRIQTSLINLGKNKAVVAARAISEIDPFIKVKIFEKGITEENMEEFLCGDGKLDLLFDECDSLDIKIWCRIEARKLRIPVLMDTSDRCMIDIERFDLEPQRELLHGLAAGLSKEKLGGLSNEQKIPHMLKMIGAEGLSDRAKASMIEIGQSINTWPQLASTVVNGAGASASIARRILLNQLSISGRFYVDAGEIIKEPIKPLEIPEEVKKKPEPLSKGEIEEIIKLNKIKAQLELDIDQKTLEEIIKDAGLAPSSGNDQPWIFVKHDSVIYLFHDINRSWSFGDYKNKAAYTGLGAALENFLISSKVKGFEFGYQIFPNSEVKRLVAALFLSRKGINADNYTQELSLALAKRVTNRKMGPRVILPNQQEVLEALKESIKPIEGAKLRFTEDEAELNRLGKIISKVDRMRVFHPVGHYDFFYREMRWSSKEAEEKRDGMDINTLEIPQSGLLALKMVKEEPVIETLRDIDGGRAFEAVTTATAMASSAMGILTMPSYSDMDFVKGGMAMERLWIKANQMNVALHPLIAPLYLFPRILHGKGEGLDSKMIDELWKLRAEFLEIFSDGYGEGEIFLFKIFKAEEVSIRSLRFPLEKIYLEL